MSQAAQYTTQRRQIGKHDIIQVVPLDTDARRDPIPGSAISALVVTLVLVLVVIPICWMAAYVVGVALAVIVGGLAVLALMSANDALAVYLDGRNLMASTPYVMASDARNVLRSTATASQMIPSCDGDDLLHPGHPTFDAWIASFEPVGAFAALTNQASFSYGECSSIRREYEARVAYLNDLATENDHVHDDAEDGHDAQAE